MSTPRQYEVRPGNAVYAAIIGTVVLAALLIAIAVLTPLRGMLVGPGSRELRVVAERNAARAAALEDSLVAQDEQVDLLRALITGDAPVESASVSDEDALSETSGSGPSAEKPEAAEPASAAVSGSALPADERLGREGERYVATLRAPSPLPLDGVVSRAFAPRRGHWGLDVAADTGTPVRSAGAGTIVLSDWTQDGGLTVAVQHRGGYLSVYKHNSRLMHRAGDRVQARETLALSGNTGEVTSGPHVHLEVWRDGLALDPASFFTTR